MVIEMEKGQATVLRLMERSDEVKQRLVDMIEGSQLADPPRQGKSYGASSSGVNPLQEPLQQHKEIEIAAECAKSQQNSKKPPKRIAPPGPGKNSEGKHVRR